MTATAFKPKPAPAPAPPAAATPRPRKPVPLAPVRKATAKSMRKLADSVQKSHPDMITHEHIRDAAKQVEAGNEEEAQGHLRAAMFSLTPQSLMRNGLHTDDAHQAARQAMHGVHRHLLLTKSIASADAKNQAAIRRDSGDGAAVPPPRPDLNAGYGPGALAQKPTVRQPPGDQALNAPAKADGGGSDPSVAGPGAPQKPGSRQFTTWGEVAGMISAIELVGPGGWGHNWTAGGPTAAQHDKAARLHTRAAAKAKNPAAKAMHLRRAKVHAQVAKKLRSLSEAKPPVPAGLAYGWGDLGALVELSAKTASLEATPAPIGKPGGPGLYQVSGLEHAPYFQQVRNGLMHRGVPEGKAHAMTWSILRRWAAGGGKVHPEVQAAAQKAIAEEEAKGAQAKGHSHATSWDDVARAVELATVIELFNPAEARVPSGATAGQFTTGGAAQPAAGQQPASGKQPPPKPLTAAQKHALHVAHVAHTLKVSTAKAELLVTAQDDQQKAAGLRKQRDALVKALASAGGKVSAGQAGAKTSTTAKTKTTAPATAASTSAAAAPATASTAKSTAKTAAAKAPAAPAKAGSAAAMKAQIAQLDTQIGALLAAAATATAQASKMK